MPLLSRRSIQVLAKSFTASKSAHHRPTIVSLRCFSEQPEYKAGDYTSVHFRVSSTPHPLATDSDNLKAKPVDISENRFNGKDEPYGQTLGDHTGLQQNHIWTESEIQEKISTLYHHAPQTYADRAVHTLMFSMYHTFNFFTGYTHVNPSVQSITWRLIVLESVAGVPGFVAAGFRHFHSLRTLKRDHGWIATLLEEAENERMHLLLCLNKFEAGPVTRVMVVAAQMIMVPVLMAGYTISPKSCHRFVGYLEETACKTYVNIIDHVETPGTHLNLAWKDMDASPLAKGYYKLPDNAKWVDTLKCMMADESHHRDVNHTLADMERDAPNPFTHTHRDDNQKAWHLHNSGGKAWEESPAVGAAGLSKPVYKSHFTHNQPHNPVPPTPIRPSA